MSAASFVAFFERGGGKVCLLEVVSEANLQANICEVLEVVQAHVDIDCGLNADMVVQVETVADLGGEIDIVDACGYVLVLEHATKEESVLYQVVASTCSKTYTAVAIMMRPAELAKQHPTVGNEIAGIGLQTDVEVGVLAVTHTKACALKVSAYILCALLELCESTH